MPADFAKALRGKKEVYVGISGISRSVPQGGGATSEEQITDPEVRDGFLTGLSSERGSPGDPFRVMIPLERVAYVAFFEKEEKGERAGPIKRVVIE